MSNRLAASMIVAWTIVYGWIGVASHLSLRTNAYDLSLFDYALWNTVHGRPGFVPFIGHSIFSEHFMPVLFLLAPVYAAAQEPVTLILVQIAAAAAAAWLLHRIAVAAAIGAIASFAIVVAFLVSRRSHEALASFFYPESLQPLLMFGLVLAWLGDRPVLYWVSVGLLLATKEDAAVYVAAFAGLQLVTTPARRSTAAVTLALAAVWFAVAVGVMIPHSRAADGLPGASHFLTARYGEGGSIASGALASRVVSVATVSRVFNLLAPFGLVSLAAPAWLAVAVPGLLIDRAAAPEAMQSALTGHYAFPLLPWIAIAAIFGLRRIAQTRPHLSTVWAVVILLVTGGEAPIVRPSTAWRIDDDATRVRAQLPAGLDGRVVAQPNLIPHLPHDNRIAALWPGVDPGPDAGAVALTAVGDLWPFTSPQQVRTAIEAYRADGRFVERTAGPLYWFARTQEGK